MTQRIYLSIGLVAAALVACPDAAWSYRPIKFADQPPADTAATEAAPAASPYPTTDAKTVPLAAAPVSSASGEASAITEIRFKDQPTVASDLPKAQAEPAAEKTAIITTEPTAEEIMVKSEPAAPLSAAPQPKPAETPILEKAPLADLEAKQPQPAAPLVAAVAEAPKAPATPRRDDLVELVSRTFSEAGNGPSANEENLPPGPMPYYADGPYGYTDACCPPQRPLYWVGGVEASFLWPDLNRFDGAVFRFVDEAQAVDKTFSSFTDGVDSMYLTPRLWLGVQGCAWGANVRYWHLRAHEGSFDSTLSEDDWEYGDWDWNAAPDVGFFANSRLEAYTVDLEITRRFCLHDCAMQASFGVRYGLIDHHESIVGTSFGDDARFAGYARSDRFSRGTGIVMGLYGRKPLFPCSCLHWFYNVRWSALWGPTATSAETFAAVMADGGSAGSVNAADTRTGDTLFVSEFQLGLEWNYALQCLPANAFFRAAVEYQRWTGGSGFSEAGSFATFTDQSNFVKAVSAYTSAAEPDLDLVGITLGTGLTW